MLIARHVVSLTINFCLIDFEIRMIDNLIDILVACRRAFRIWIQAMTMEDFIASQSPFFTHIQFLFDRSRVTKYTLWVAWIFKLWTCFVLYFFPHNDSY